MDMSDINLIQPDFALFDKTADKYAQIIAGSGGDNKNKATQLRGFYDEILMWEQRCRAMKEDKVQEQIPLIKMINAKVAYARGRKLVDKVFYEMIRRCLEQVDDYTTLRNCKLFLEAFMGFYKMHKPDPKSEL